jgi:hypothetical protein
VGGVALGKYLAHFVVVEAGPVVRIRVRGIVVRIRVGDTAIRVRVVVRTPDDTGAGTFSDIYLPLFILADEPVYGIAPALDGWGRIP